MTYCVYFKNTGAIQAITDKRIETDELSYIPISNEHTQMFLTGSVGTHEYRVVHSDKRLIEYKEIITIRNRVDDRIFGIPKNQNQADCVVVQNIKDKTCLVSLSNIAKLITDINGITLVACLPGNPYAPLWIWNIKFSDLLDNDVKINYTGTDSFTFYTKRYFNTYSHETI
jgi:hypothetical protein